MGGSHGIKRNFFRLLLALIVGGLTGIERGRLNKFVGFRIHMLVSLGIVYHQLFLWNYFCNIMGSQI